jgi:hypothetical protein
LLSRLRWNDRCRRAIGPVSLLVVLGAMIPAAAGSPQLVNTKSFLQCAYDAAGNGAPDNDDPQRAPCVDGAFQMIKDLKVLLNDPEQFASTASGKDSSLHDSVPPQSNLPCVCVCVGLCDSFTPHIPTHAQQPLGHPGWRVSSRAR